MIGCKPAITHVDACSKSSMVKSIDNEATDKLSYQRLVGKLIYLSHARPDICYAMSYISQFMHNITVHHLKAAMRILRYLKNAPGQGLYLRKTEDKGLAVFTDADWGSSFDMRSTTGYGAFLWGNLVTWRSKKQPVVSRSSAEAELLALTLGLYEGLWINRVVKDLGLTVMNLIQYTVIIFLLFT